MLTVYVFGGGINENVAPVKVSADGSVVEGTYPETRRIEGGYTILELPTGAQRKNATPTASPTLRGSAR